MDKSLDLLGLRLAEVEYQLYGNGHEFVTGGTHNLPETSTGDENITPNETTSMAPGPTFQYPPNLNIGKMLMEIESKLKALTIGKDRFNQCYNELQRLQKWLREDDQMDSLIQTFGSHASVVKFEQVLAFEDEIRMDAERIAELERLLPSLDKTHLSKIDQLEPQLIRLKLELMQQQHISKQLNKETNDLIEKFNIWYQGIMDQIQQMNEDITQMERKKEEIRYDI